MVMILTRLPPNLLAEQLMFYLVPAPTNTKASLTAPLVKCRVVLRAEIRSQMAGKVLLNYVKCPQPTIARGKGRVLVITPTSIANRTNQRPHSRINS